VPSAVWIGQVLRDGIAGGIISGGVDAKARRQVGHRAAQRALRVGEVVLSDHRLSVGIDVKGHAYLLDVALG
jgi:hypothetical protein